MISSEEFQQQLQSGQIHEALALVSRDPTLLQRGFTHELDVTTSIPNASTTAERVYLRSKINLLTGKIEHEISQPLMTDRASYLQLQQLHIDQIVASYRLVQGHLDRVKAILMAFLPVTSGRPPSGATAGAVALDATTLATQLCRSLSMSRERNLAATPVEPGEFDEIDLSVHEDNEIWEEWVEDDDFPLGTVMPQPTPVPDELKLPALQEHWVRRPLNPIDVKPIVPRATSAANDLTVRWDKFVPEYIEINPDPAERSQLNRSIDTARIDRLLANLVGASETATLAAVEPGHEAPTT